MKSEDKRHIFVAFLVYCPNDRETHKAKHFLLLFHNYLCLAIIKRICFVDQTIKLRITETFIFIFRIDSLDENFLEDEKIWKNYNFLHRYQYFILFIAFNTSTHNKT
jgi:hypothetical protein